MSKEVRVNHDRIQAEGYDIDLFIIGPFNERVDTTGYLGSVSEGGYLVVEGYRGSSYLFQGGSVLAAWYVAEKLALPKSKKVYDAATVAIALRIGRKAMLYEELREDY